MAALLTSDAVRLIILDDKHVSSGNPASAEKPGLMCGRIYYKILNKSQEQ